jgi:hypothetical protein
MAVKAMAAISTSVGMARVDWRFLQAIVIDGS